MKMKINNFLSVLLLIFLCCSISCKKKPDEKIKYPIVLGEHTYIGKIVEDGNPCTTKPCLPCSVLWLETTFGYYVLSINSNWFCDRPIIVDALEYLVGDEVEITGTLTKLQDIHSKEFFNFEIKTIKIYNF